MNEIDHEFLSAFKAKLDQDFLGQPVSDMTLGALVMQLSVGVTTILVLDNHPMMETDLEPCLRKELMVLEKRCEELEAEIDRREVLYNPKPFNPFAAVPR